MSHQVSLALHVHRKLLILPQNLQQIEELRQQFLGQVLSSHRVLLF